MKSIVTALVMVVILVGTLVVAFDVRLVEASGTIYIRADGSVDPPTAPISTVDSVTYTFTGDIYESIVVQRNNITIDGAGYLLQGPESGTGCYLDGMDNVTIRNTVIRDFRFGIGLNNSSHNSLSDNNIVANNEHIFGGFGIWINNSLYNSLSSNTIADSTYGIALDSSSHYNSISGNNITNSVTGIILYSSSHISLSGNMFTNCGLQVMGSFQNSVEDNTVNGKPLVYLEGVTDHTVDYAGQVILLRCENVRVEDLNLSRITVGVELWETSGTTISRNTVTDTGHGILLFYSSNNTISENTGTNNSVGIRLHSSSNYNNVSSNSITASNAYALGLDWSSYNSISGNNMTANSHEGIYLYQSSHNSIQGNDLTNNNMGLQLRYSANNNISSNNIARNAYGVYLDYSSDNGFWHNNFVNNTQQTDSEGSTNVWDDGYPSGGNYWSDYTDFDSFRGLHQNETGSDGVWDHPYIIYDCFNENNQDRYPLTKLFTELAGDVDGDRDVDILDIVRMAGAYGTKSPDPKYDPTCDIDGDGDIDIFDIVIAAGNYGKSW